MNDMKAKEKKKIQFNNKNKKLKYAIMSRVLWKFLVFVSTFCFRFASIKTIIISIHSGNFFLCKKKQINKRHTSTNDGNIWMIAKAQAILECLF